MHCKNHVAVLHSSCRKYYYACPDDETFRFLARIYSKSHHNMSLSKEFEEGITNGASWYHIQSTFLCLLQLMRFLVDALSKMLYRYPIYGGMQDWNYIHGGCFELTLEISDKKWPKASEVTNLIFLYVTANCFSFTW